MQPPEPKPELFFPTELRARSPDAENIPRQKQSLESPPKIGTKLPARSSRALSFLSTARTPPQKLRRRKEFPSAQSSKTTERHASPQCYGCESSPRKAETYILKVSPPAFLGSLE